ncbi:hypothetical protein B1729_16940 [Microbacterium sp. B35-04]|nr:metalloregulator ArsR/SmtB family transcription factor [Microbacterium sp. B35-04]KAF2412058.1 hypothetical protein B1729_16940 [Microbacterium sp. B35-04]KAF2416941.1 hypothetical protein B2K11_14190 [Microbacterium sp. B35-30]
MLEWLTALSDTARWRIVRLLADRPRSVGVIAELTGLRQPQASKHLQTLERAGLAVSRRSGQRRIYALEPEAMLALGSEITRLAEVAADGRALFDRYASAVEAETVAAEHGRWPDERDYVFRRTLPASTATVWRYLSEPELLSQWWAPADLRLAHLEFGPQPGQPINQTYVDADDRSGKDGVIGHAIGAIEQVDPQARLTFVLSPLLADGSTAFTAHYVWLLGATEAGTDFEMRLRITDTSAPSAEFIAGIELSWDQCLDRLVSQLAAIINEGEPK